jgi:restriction system protein
MVRAGRNGEFEEWALRNNVAGGGFREVGDISGCGSRDEVLAALTIAMPERASKALLNFAAQLWTLRGRIQKGDIIVLPLKTTKQIAIGRCTADYKYLPGDDPSLRHSVAVEWVRTDVSRADLKQDLLFSLGAFMTICKIDRNDAENRLSKILSGGVDPGADLATLTSDQSDGVTEGDVVQIDIEDVATDGIRTRLVETFQSHQLAELTAAVLRTRGLTCVVSPPGPDKGIDIIAGSGPLGLDSPRIVVQCKSGQAPVDVSVIQRLQGAMGTTGADQALLVAFGGVNRSASDLLTNQQFRVKVWDADLLVEAFIAAYPNLDESIKEMLPLKNVWTLADPEG